MQKLLGSLALTAALAFAGGSFACPMGKTASADPTMVTAQAPSQSTAPAAGTTTTPKTPQANSGG
jgi:hypothetical protein